MLTLVLVSLVAACSGPEEGDDTTTSSVATETTLPSTTSTSQTSVSTSTTLSPDEEKAKAFVEFVANSASFTPTVNLIDESQLPVTVPFVEVLDHVVVDVGFGDDVPAPFMFDTGAPTIVSQAIADAQGGEVIVETASATGGGAVIWTPLQRYQSINFADAVTITEATAQAPWEPEGGLYCVTTNGLFGAPAMSHAVWQVNYESQEITVASSVDQLEHIDGAIQVPFAIQPGVSPTPYVALGIGDGALQALVDTGGGIPLTLGTADLESLGIEVPADAPRADGIGFGAGGAFEVHPVYMELPVTLGDQQFNVPISVSDGMAPGAGGNIGHVFLENFVVTFDWTSNAMYLDPLFDGDTLPALNPPPSAGVTWDGTQLVVGGLPQGSPAAEAGLTLGEVVTELDGQSVEGLTQDAYCSDIAGQQHDTLTTASGTYDASPMEGFFANMGGG